MSDARHDDSLETGIRAAFAAAPMSSVLRVLQAKTNAKLGVHLPDAKGEQHDSILKVSAESKSLRDSAGRYQVLGEIGRGGVGVVFKGHDVDLGRDVALKVLHEKFAQQPEILARFVEEAQIGGQLQHPGIVPVYELGLQNGERPFFAMKLVKGETLAEQLIRRKDASEDRRRLLGIFEQVCHTVAYAHARRVVHRDLKPANVMIGAFGEVQVVDWGFAKVLPKPGERAESPAQRAVDQSQVSVISTVRSGTSSSSHSIAGSMMGTPAYMPPEQAIGDIEHMDQRSDVFGLGAILCEILTGRAVYRGEDGDLIQQAARADVVGAHARIESSGADASLISLCKQCLSPARQARPASASEVAAQIGAYLTSVEDRAREAQIHAAEAKVKARSTVMLAAAALLIVVLGGGGYFTIERAAATRREHASQRVAEAMNEASGLVGQARAAGLQDLALWERAVSASEHAERLAKADDVADEQRTRVGALLTSARDERATARAAAARSTRDTTMLKRLVEVRVPSDESVREAGWQLREARRLDAAYAECFATYLGGRDLLTLDLDAAAMALEEGAIEVDLAAGLDHWAMQRRALSEGRDAPGAIATKTLNQLAARIDHDDLWRSDLRARLALPERDRSALEALAENADFDALPVASIALLGDALWSLGAEATAIVVYRHGQTICPGDFALSFRLALMNELCHPPRGDAAIADYRIAVALQPEMKEARLRLGDALSTNGAYAESIEVNRRLIEFDPSFGKAYYNLGCALRSQGHLDDAITSFRQAIELGPTYAAPHHNLGVALQAQGHLDEAIASYRQAIELDPKGALPHSNLGVALQAQGHLDEAIASYREAIELDPKYAGFHYNLGVALQAQGHLDEAIASYRDSIELDPKFATAHIALGLVLSHQDHLDEALSEYRTALELDPKSASAHNNLGLVLSKQDHVDEAISEYRMAIEVDPTFAVAHFNLGNTLRSQGQLEDAIGSYRHSIELDPKFASVHVNLGNVLVNQGRLDEAIASYRHAIELDPKFGTAHYSLGNALKAQGRLDEAIASFRKEIELDPKSAVSFNNLGLALMDQGRLDEAVANYRQEIESHPNSAPVHNSLANALEDQGRLDEAIATYRHAIELDPKYAASHYNLAGSLQSQGHLGEALSEYRRALELVSPHPDASSVEWALTCKSRIETLEQRLAGQPELLAILRAERDGTSVEEWSNAAQFAIARKTYLAALRTYERAFSADSHLLEQYPLRYNAACCAALAAFGQGADAVVLTDVERAGLRGKALTWMRAEVVAWRGEFDGSELQAHQALEHFTTCGSDPDFAGVRDEAALTLLPAEEAESWRGLWRDVAELSERPVK